ncbi:ornithine decarboxylase antizyme 1, partial [Neocloeon triangulifer]|uniref:ornithine decarboxylase antizyme 1 n=1 Tax=Neocloeon triangulifer TaxID=2078957 RepID=UPI00286FAE02
LWAAGLGGGPDVPHAACVTPSSPFNTEGSGVGKPKELSVSHQNAVQEELGRRHGGAEQGSVRLTFVLHLAQNTEVRWESVLWQGRLYLQVPSCLLPEGSKEGFVSILEYAEDVLQCKSIILCLKKDRTDRALLVRTFMFLGFQVLPPDHELVPASIESNLYMYYSIE